MQTRPRLEWLARAGYGARGVVFLLVAGLALFSTFGGSGKPDTKSAMQTLLSQPLGRVWLGLIALGLLGFVAWRLAQSIGNADTHKDDLKGYIIRAALLGSAATYVGLAIYAGGHALGMIGGSGDSDESKRSMAAWIMGQPFGPWLAGLVGLGFVIGGGVTIWKGVSQKFRKYIKLGGDRTSPLALICVYGLSARGAVFAIVGVFFCYAAFTVDPDQAGSMGDALAWVRQLPFGAILYFIVALGLAAFGLYNMIEARYRIVDTPDVQDLKHPLSN
ncbi:DUF1206 domain-containing protein [Rhizobium halophytocola]|uniref:DUF1206 domain-containing protein n=1 Tax=Rhizobium halophytocola TaxID=735519 RepID=A0ABS4DVS8_9HYPH|nr:DUF1206 domain-containing protein [Rhizobium halophytocola]MBP1849801.1 hypothetical protein [Rhizobium halophytocola]